jgi:type I restriction enzyme, S subunit
VFNVENPVVSKWAASLPAGRLCRLCDYVEPVTDTAAPESSPETEFTYIDIGSVDATVKKVLSAMPVLGKDAPSRARRIARAGNLLVSTVRPQRGAIGVVPPEFDGALASTGFTQLRPIGSTRVEFVRYLLWTALANRQVGMLSTGASYPAISEEDLLSIRVPQATVSEQEHICDQCMIAERRAERIALEERRIQNLANRIIRRALANIFDLLDDEKFQEVLSVASETEDKKAVDEVSE